MSVGSGKTPWQVRRAVRSPALLRSHAYRLPVINVLPLSCCCLSSAMGALHGRKHRTRTPLQAVLP